MPRVLEGFRRPLPLRLMPRVLTGNPDAPLDAPLQVGIAATTLPATSALERDYAAFFREAYPKALAHARRRLGPPADAEVAQNAAITLWHRWGRLVLEERTLAFFLGIVNNCVHDGKREPLGCPTRPARSAAALRHYQWRHVRWGERQCLWRYR